MKLEKHLSYVIVSAFRNTTIFSRSVNVKQRIVHSLQCRRILSRECTFSYLVAIMDLVTVEDWGEKIFAEGVGVK